MFGNCNREKTLPLDKTYGFLCVIFSTAHNRANKEKAIQTHKLTRSSAVVRSLFMLRLDAANEKLSHRKAKFYFKSKAEGKAVDKVFRFAMSCFYLRKCFSFRLSSPNGFDVSFTSQGGGHVVVGFCLSLSDAAVCASGALE